MNNRLAVSLIAASLLVSRRGFCPVHHRAGCRRWREGGRRGSWPGRRNRRRHRRCGGRLSLEIPNAVITSIQRDRPRLWSASEVVVGEPLPPTVELRTVPQHTEYRYAVVNDRRVIVEPRTRKVVKIID